MAYMDLPSAKLKVCPAWYWPEFGSDEWLDLVADDAEVMDGLDDECSGMLPGVARIHRREFLIEGITDASRAWRLDPAMRERLDRQLEMSSPQFVPGAGPNALRARRYGGVVDMLPAHWVSVAQAFGHACVYCESHDGITMDHVIALSRGGEHSIRNVVPACSSCNSSKNASDLIEWVDRKGFDLATIMGRVAKARDSLVAEFGPACLKPGFLNRVAA